MENITYFFGAGASHGHIPIVKEMSQKIRDIITKIMQRPLGDNVFISPNLDVESTKGKLLKSLEWLERETNNGNTIDTYARKLFLLGEEIKLNELKATLTVCFYYWQFFEVPVTQVPTPNIDNRYIPLMGKFLGNDKLGNIVLAPNVNFLTWNYDLQLELALKYFDAYTPTITGIQKKFKSFPNESLDGYVDNPKIIHLNGIAGLYSSGNYTGIRMDDLRIGTYDYWSSVMADMLVLYDLLVLRKEAHNNHVFTFAWEANAVSKLAIRRAIEVMEETSYLVVIGYSFPDYNNDIDRQLFSSKTVSKLGRVYYIDKFPNSVALAATFGIQRAKIHEITDIEKFILPYEYSAPTKPFLFA